METFEIYNKQFLADPTRPVEIKVDFGDGGYVVPASPQLANAIRVAYRQGVKDGQAKMVVDLRYDLSRHQAVVEVRPAT